MTSSAPTSKLPTWIFFAADAALLAAAWFIAAQGRKPLANAAIFAVVACVIAGAIIATIPLLVRYEREKNEALDERQRALEALAATIANSAEQISTAAAGLHTINELAHKNLRHAEQLPHKLQEKIAEFQAQLANADDTEKEELEQELTALRTSESERLEAISDKIAKSAADWTKLEAATQKNLATLQEALTQAQSQLAGALDEKLAAALSKLDTKLAALTTAAPAAALAPGLASVVELPAPASGPDATDKPEDLAHPPKRIRKTRRNDPEVAPLHEKKFPDEEPPPVHPHEILPVAPGTDSPFKGHITTEAPPQNATAPAAATPVATATPPPLELKVARKRIDKKPAESAAEPSLGLEIPGSSAVSAAAAPSSSSGPTPASPEETAPAAASADGATRLIVTAYIGIGNRLFIRGEGPGLSWEKGVPLQFVSIGKWRWETSAATAPVKFKLYKNDDLECTAPGIDQVASGHQQEVTATF